MRATLLLSLIFAQLFWWDLLDRVRICLSWDHAHRAIDREVSLRAQRLFALARFATGLSLRVELDNGLIPDRFVVVANHQSVMDIVAIMAAFRTRAVRFVAKRELRRGFPAVSQVLRVQRHALIARHGDFASAMHEIERLGRTLRPGEGAVIFPEGTRSLDGEVRAFHSGAIRRLVAHRPLPIVVLALDGGAGLSRLADLARMKRGHIFRLRLVGVLPPVTGKRALIAQIAEAESLIRKAIEGWRANT